MSSKITDLRLMLYKTVQTTEDVSALRVCLEQCEKANLMCWTDTDGYDILHHAIMAGNIEAVGMLFALGHFKPPHEPKKHSYIHLAANYGNRSIAVMLLQERPRDYSTKKTLFRWSKQPTEAPLISKDNTSMVNSLDVAAESGHVSCVKSILDVSSVKTKLEFGSDNYLSAACASNSPSALRLLLKQKPSADDVKSAVGAALKLANAECLDVLLRCNPSLTTLFSGMNLYHVLYSYSLSFKKEWYESLLTVTSVLLKHKQSPACAVPFRTYPLYSLLSHIPASDFGKSSPYITACMVVLLNAGVDPDFDEVAFEIQNESKNIQTAFGRSAYSSALHCLYDNVSNLLRNFDDDATNIRRFVTKCTETLLRHSANPAIIGPIGDRPNGLIGNALHAFLKVAIILGLDERSITTFRLLVQNGGDPNEHESGKFPINTFCEEILVNAKLFDKLHKTEEESLTSYVTEIAFTLLENMTLPSVIETCKVDYGGKPTHSLQKRLFKLVRDEMQRRSASVWRLTELCRLCILQACGWQSTNVVDLPVPTTMKMFLNKDLDSSGAPNIYAGKRNFIHQLMDVALLMANVSQLKSLLSMDKGDKYFSVTFAFICCSIALQVVFPLCMLIIFSIERKIQERLIEKLKEKHPSDGKRRILAERLDKAGNILVLLIIVSNVFITGFGIDVNGIRGSENLVPQTAAVIILQNGTTNTV